MAQSRIQNVVAIVVLIPALLCFWLVDAASRSTDAAPLPVFTVPDDDLAVVGPIGDLVRLGSVDAMPVLSEKDTPKTLKVIVVTRHGMYLKRQPKEFTGLSEKGKDLMELVGKLLMKRYEAHFQNIAKTAEDIISLTSKNPILVGLTASDKYINKNSADEIIVGMKKQNEEQLKFLNPRFLDDRSVDYNLFFNPFGNTGNCNKFTSKANQYLHDPEKYNIQHNKFGQFTVEKVFKQYNEAQEKRLEGLELPNELKNDEGKRTLRQMKRIAIERMKNELGTDIDYWKYFVSPFFNYVFEKFALRNPSKNHPHFHLHVTDDHLMTAFVWFLQLNPAIQAAFGPPGDDLYYPQAGDSLVLEIDDNYMMAYYLRLVGESEPIGFKKISLFSFKQLVDGRPTQASDASSLQTYPSVYAMKLENQLIKKDEWENYCKA